MTTITITIGKRIETMVLFKTNAHKNYDHGAAIELYDGTYQEDGREHIERYVLIPLDALEWQRGRNSSGLHSCDVDDVVLDEPELARYLWDRLYGRHA